MKQFKKKVLNTLLVGALGVGISTSSSAALTVSALITGYVNSALKMYETQWDSVYNNVKGGNVASSILQTTNNLVTRITEIEINLVKRLDKSDLKISGELDKATNTIQDRLIKVGQGQIQANSARSHYKTQKKIESNINKATEDFEQPITNCMQYAAGQSFADGMMAMRLNAASAAAQIGSAVTSPTGNWELEEFETNRKNFTGENQYKDMQTGALFGSSNGSLTRVATTDNNSVKTVINYLTGLAYSPRNLGSNQDESDNGKMYSRLQRQYAAYASLSSYVLSAIANNHTPQKSLLAFYKNAGLSLTPEQEQNGVSIAELYDTYTQKLLSRPQIEANAKAKSLTLLRNMSQMDAVALYMEVQELQQQERTEALKAAELSLMTHKVLGPQAQIYTQVSKQ